MSSSEAPRLSVCVRVRAACLLYSIAASLAPLKNANPAAPTPIIAAPAAATPVPTAISCPPVTLPAAPIAPMEPDTRPISRLARSCARTMRRMSLTPRGTLCCLHCLVLLLLNLCLLQDKDFLHSHDEEAIL